MVWTFIVDFEGGTYVSQVEAPNPGQALSEWVSLFDSQKLIDLKLQQLLEDDEQTLDFVALQDVHQVWCATLLVNDTLMLINFVPTFI